MSGKASYFQVKKQYTIVNNMLEHIRKIFLPQRHYTVPWNVCFFGMSNQETLPGLFYNQLVNY